MQKNLFLSLYFIPYPGMESVWWVSPWPPLPPEPSTSHPLPQSPCDQSPTPCPWCTHIHGTHSEPKCLQFLCHSSQVYYYVIMYVWKGSSHTHTHILIVTYTCTHIYMHTCTHIHQCLQRTICTISIFGQNICVNLLPKISDHHFQYFT